MSSKSKKGKDLLWISAQTRSSSIQYCHHRGEGLGGKRGLREGKGYDF